MSVSNVTDDLCEKAEEARVENAAVVDTLRNGPLYAKRTKIHPKRVYGTYRTLKWIAMAVAMGVYYGLPWVRWDRGPGLPDQAVLVDFSERRFYFFFIEIWPQEFYYLTGLMVLAALALFLATSIAGRVYCGYVCPHTVWTDLFVQVERLIEGDRNKRMRLDKAPMSLEKAAKRLSKHTVWLLIAAATGGAWVFYFGDAPDLIVDIFQGDAPLTTYVSIALFTATTYMFGGLAREQVCIYMCPWPRIQGAMFDENSLLVSYKKDRGEPRGHLKRSESWDERGDCIDCLQCVAVCPMGIDIRDGDQLECIQCALCIDACNGVMKKIGRPKDLIGYETLAHADARARGETARVRFIRPRTLLYAGLMAIVGAIMIFGLATRSDVELTLQKERNPVFVTLSDGSVRNGYTVRILNKAYAERTFQIAVTGLEGARLVDPLSGESGVVSVAAPQDDVRTVKLFVSLPAQRLDQLTNGRADFEFTISAIGEERVRTRATTFQGPRG